MTSLEDRLRQALEHALPQLGGDAPNGVPNWEIPKDASFGDLSNSVSFRLAAKRKQPPHRVAEELAAAFNASCQRAGLAGAIERVEAKAGFLNVFLSTQALAAVLRTILRRGGRYGACAPPRPRSVNVEFVSANPTGPLSVAHGRQAAVGDVLVRLLRSQGVRARAEFYLNDEGRQIELLGRSLRARYLQALGRAEPFPEDGYHGLYVVEHGKRLAARDGDRLTNQPLGWFMQQGMKEQLAEIKGDLERFGLAFDCWTSQRWVRTSGKIDASLARLRAQGVL